MSHLNPGLISAYNSLTDKHLAGYFSNTRIRRHLQRAGLITRSGRIVPDKEYRHKLIQRAHQRHVRECLAQAIFHKVLEMERLHQIEIKRKLEEFARRERVHKIKVERARRYEEDIIRILSPRPPTGARGIRKQHSGPEGEHSESSESPGSSRPNTAPGKMQRPVRLKPIHSNSTTASVRRSSPHRLFDSSNENDPSFNCTMDKESRRRLTAMETSNGISPYCLPVINNFVTPVPPATKRKDRGVKVIPSGTLRGRRLRPTTASSGADVNEDLPMLRSSIHQSRVCVNMVYFGKTVHLSHDLTDMRDEVKVFQQHCGGENLCVYKGKLREGESFQFISRRHRGFPFSLTFFLNGLQVERLSSCCEFKHRKGSRLGGRHGHFGVSGVEGASPCYKCIIAMGLDKKPTPPPKRVKEDGGREDSIASPKDAPEMETERTAEDAASHSERETRQRQVTETQVKAETAAEEDHVRDDYEEDFEADDEGPVEDAKEKKSPSPSSETETRDKEKDASETEDEAKDEDIESRSGSSCSGSDREVSDAEATRDSREDEKAEQPDEAEQVEATAAAEEKAEPNPEEDAATKDSDLQDSAGDSTEIDISDTSVPSGTENKQSDDASADKEAENTSGGGKQEEEGQEQERAKSVQEKLAEAILKESHCSSEPELSDTSTEEEEVASVKGHEQKNNDVIPEQQQDQKALVEETKNEESVDVGEVEMVQDHEETSEPKAQEPETEKETHENSDSAKDESKIVEDDEKPASEEEEAENDKSLDTRAALHTVVEENTSEENKSSETREDAAATDDAAQKDEENEEETADAAEADAQPDETGQGAKSGGEDESSVSDPNKKTNETAVSDNAEAEVMTASETVEMKAEPSEEREALSCEEAPVTDKEERQEGDSKNRTEASETEVTTEKSSSLFEGNRETTVENTADVSENKVKDEDGQDDVKDEEVEEASGAEGSKDGNQEIMEEEQTEKSVEIDKEEVEKEKSEELNKEEEKQTNPEETPEGESSEKKENETDKTEEEENNGSKAEERIEDEENIVEESKSDTNTEGQEEEPAEKILDKEDKVAVEPRADESEKMEINEGSESVENKNDEEEPEAEKTAADKSDEGEDVNEIKMDADEEKDEEAEKEGKNDDETKTEQDESEMNKDGKESEEIKPVERDEISEITDEPEKHAEEVKVSNENAVESEDISDSEAPDGTKMGVEVLNNVIESEDVKEVNTNNEKEQVDAENGEISPRAERATHEEEPEASTEAKNDVKTSDHVEEETTDIKTEKEPTEDESAEVKEGSVTRGDDAEKQDDDKVDQTPDTDVVESEAEGVDSNEKQDEYAQKETAQETDATEVKEGCKPDSVNPGREEGEGSKQDENGNKSVLDDKNKDSDSIEKSDNNVNEVITASSAEEAQSVAPIESAVMSDKRPPSEENAAVAANADLSAADGENGADTEEASKASEEGASILLKPQQNNEADDAEKSITIGKETSEALAAQDSTDLVSNWVTVHQMSKYFQTFVEPLEDLKEETSQTQESVTSNVASKSTELPRSESPLKTVNLTSENVEKDEQEDETEVRGKSEVEAVESNLESKHSQDIEPHENSPAKDTVEEVEETEVKDLIPKTETGDDEEEPTKEQRKGSEVSLKEDKVLESGTLPSETQNEVSKTEVESIVDAHHSGGKPESVAENQTEEKRTDHGPELNEKQAETEEMKDFREQSESLHELKDAGEEMSGKTDGEKSREVTEITEFTTPRSEDGSQEETHHREIQPKPSGGSVNGERRDVQLIQDIKHTLSKDRLSTFSVDETLFGHSSYPLLTAARTESGH